MWQSERRWLTVLSVALFLESAAFFLLAVWLNT